jgi:putative NADPH-quinone reductase
LSGDDDPPVETLVLQAHPLEASYSAALRDRTLLALKDGAVAHRVYRLADGERPTVGELGAARRLILVYPTWSGGLPASLLAWSHEVLDQPSALASVTELIVITSCGSSRWVNLVQGEWGKDLLRTRILPRCAPGARFRWLALYKVDRRSEEEMTRHLDRVERSIGAWTAGRAS